MAHRRLGLPGGALTQVLNPSRAALAEASFDVIVEGGPDASKLMIRPHLENNGEHLRDDRTDHPGKCDQE